MRLKFILILFLLLFFTSKIECAPPSRPNVYNPNETISSADVTENENELYNYTQAGVDTYADNSIVNADIASGANIQSDKLNLTSMSQNMANSGNLTLSSGNLIFTPSAAQTIDAVGDIISANAIIVVVDPDADYTLTSAPTIADGTSGQILIIGAGNSEANIVTVQDQDSLASSNLQLGASSRAISGKDTLLLRFDGVDWVEIIYANN